VDHFLRIFILPTLLHILFIILMRILQNKDKTHKCQTTLQRSTAYLRRVHKARTDGHNPARAGMPHGSTNHHKKLVKKKFHLLLLYHEFIRQSYLAHLWRSAFCNWLFLWRICFVLHHYWHSIRITVL
jgi:hypothetical protein